MNETTLTQLKILVERAVRPVRASMDTKRKMREELLAHVSGVFEEEAAKLGDELIALDRTSQRFGNPAELTGPLQESVPALDFTLCFVEDLTVGFGESTLRRAARWAMLVLATWGGFLLTAIVVQGRMNEWPLVFVGPVFTFSLIVLADGMRHALYGPTGPTWPRAAVVAVASWLVIPGVTFGILLIYSGDVWTSLRDVRPLLWGGVLAPVTLAVPLYGVATAVRSHQEWERLPIE
jgi:hypothetical protein